jgi:PucR C-terminal helix-turn-helix domain
MADRAGASTGLELAADVVEGLRAQLPAVAERTVAAVIAEVAEYADPLRGELGANITRAVEMALGTFLRVAESSATVQPEGPISGALEGAYALGRGEARAGRTMDALLAAYRVGARVAWRDWGGVAVEADVRSATVVQFAELVFAYIDQLSAASVAGHSDELATSGRVRAQYLDRLGRALISGATDEELVQRAEQADWSPPETLTAVLLPSSHASATASALDRRTLVLSADVTGTGLPEDMTTLLVPDVEASRASLLQTLRRRPAVVGPTRGWTDVAGSFRRAARVLTVTEPHDSPVDTEDHLSTLVVTADPEATADLRGRMLAPLADLPPATAARLADTLRSWLLHQGRRDDVARELFIHPQTVRYRMAQLRSLYGERLLDPTVVFELVVALGRDGVVSG